MTSNPEWGPGLWDDEPDELAWQDARTGLQCKIKRHLEWGQLNGYVGVPPGHPLFGWDYDDDIRLDPELLQQGSIDSISIFSLFTYSKEEYNHGTIPVDLALQVHGGLSWSAEEEGLWWFGFDCGHAQDLSPGLQSFLRGIGSGHLGRNQTYRTISYVKQQCRDLAFQLKRLEAAKELTAVMEWHP